MEEKSLQKSLADEDNQLLLARGWKSLHLYISRKDQDDRETCQSHTHTAVDMAVPKFPRLVHSTCTNSASALEMHSAQVLEMLVQM